MANYLSRKEILRVFDNLTVKNPDDKYQHGMQDAIDCLIPEVINGMEASDVQPVRHGRWIPQGDDMWLCSNCNENKIFSMHKSDRTEKQRYCCKCGARMDGDTNG